MSLFDIKEFRGGIQKGTVAADIHAKRLDKDCKKVAGQVNNDLTKIYGCDIVFKKKFKKNQIPGKIGACAPDGGLWFYKNKLIACFEGKKQGDRGNAIERWFKNNFVCRIINTDMSYVTFCTGEGSKIKYNELTEKMEYGIIVKTLNIDHLDQSGNGIFNQYVPGKNSAFLSPEGFTEKFIYDIMMEVIQERIENINSNETVI